MAQPGCPALEKTFHILTNTNTEDRIQAARRFYNGNVRLNNNKVGGFPSNMVAKVAGFAEREFFEIEGISALAAPRVNA